MRAPLLIAFSLVFVEGGCEAIYPRSNNPKNCMVNPGICEAMGAEFACSPLTERCEQKGGSCNGPVDCAMATAAACPDRQCVPCSADNQCKAWSQARVLAMPLDFCVGGMCGNCRTNADCAGSSVGGICDDKTHLCRGCEANSECDSAVGAGDGICRRPGDYPETPPVGVETGKCVSSNLIAFATNKGSGCEMMSNNGSTLSRPYCNLTIAAASGKPYIKVLPANHTALSLNGTSVNLVGPGREAAQGAILAGLAVTGGTVSVSDLQIMPTGGAVGAQCRGNASLYLTNTKVTSSASVAVDASQDCSKIVVDRSRLEATGELAITVGLAGTQTVDFRIVNSAILQSGSLTSQEPVRLDAKASMSGIFAFNTLVGAFGGVRCASTTQTITDSIISVSAGMAVRNCSKQRVSEGAVEFASTVEPKLNQSATNQACCIDKGEKPANFELPTDYFGNKRPVGAGFDIGFHEVK